MNAQDQFISIGEKTLFVRTWQQHDSEKTPIILLHDSIGCVELWRDFPETLSRKTQRTVIAYDRFGYGKSSENPIPQKPDFISKEAELYFPALLQHLNIGKFMIFGHSVGGAMGVYCAAKFADSCETLITESTMSFVEDRTLEGIYEAKAAFADESNIERLKKYHGEKTQWVLDAWIETWTAENFRAWSLKEILPEVQCPLLSMHGSNDEYGSLKHPQLIVDFAGSDSRLEILSGCKHIPHREKPTLVLDLVANFLGKIG